MNIFQSLLLAAPLSLSSFSTAPLTRVPGVVEGYSALRNGDDQVDGALVMPTLRAQEVLQFQLEAFLAPEEDLQAGPKTVRVPGNLHFPRQSENFGIFPVTISKPEFGFYTTKGRTEEVITLSFRAPFSKMLDLAQAKVPFTEFIPLLSLRQYTFAADKDWSNDRSMRPVLNGTFQKTMNFTWTRSAPPTNSLDVAINFQKSPASRWAVTDVVGRPGTSSQLATAAALVPETKSLFLRIFNGSNRQPVAGVGYFAAGGVNNKHVINGVPPQLRQVNAKTDQVTWEPVAGPGWMAIIRESKYNQQVSNPDGSPGIQAEYAAQSLEAWVNPAAGTYSLASPLKSGEKLILLFVGTSQEVPAPSADESEPALFTYASEIRFIRL
jgi:hypothetical protein